jgi:hypothetical protein
MEGGARLRFFAALRFVAFLPPNGFEKLWPRFLFHSPKVAAEIFPSQEELYELNHYRAPVIDLERASVRPAADRSGSIDFPPRRCGGLRAVGP